MPRQRTDPSCHSKHTQLTSQVAGNSAGLDAAYMNKMVLAYVLSRFVFVHMYIKATTQRASLVRSLAWWAGNGKSGPSSFRVRLTGEQRAGS